MFKQITDQNQWNDIVNNHKLNHPLQLWGWGEVKKINGWHPLRLVSEGGIFAAQILLKKLPKLNFYLAYIPRGPLCSASEFKNYLPELSQILRSKKALSLRLEPGYSSGEAANLDLSYSRNKILMNQTLQINLESSIEELRSKFASKTRQYVNKSAKVTVIKHFSDIDEQTALDDIFKIYQDTAQRAGFKLQSKKYYGAILSLMKDNLDIYISYSTEDQPLAFLWNAFSKDVYFELYGGISQQGQNLKANYALKFKAIESAKSAGCQIYDFNGRLNDGVSKFKKSFGPSEVDYVKTLQLSLSPLSKLSDLAERLARRF